MKKMGKIFSGTISLPLIFINMNNDNKAEKEDILIKMTKAQLRLSLGKFLIDSGTKTKSEVLTTLMNQYINEQGL